MEVPAAGGGRFRSYVIDFGVEVVGTIGMEAEGADGGEVVDTQVSETLDGLAPEVLSPYFDCRVAMGNRLTLRAGTTRHETFEPMGFRYLAVTVRETARPLGSKCGSAARSIRST